MDCENRTILSTYEPDRAAVTQLLAVGMRHAAIADVFGVSVKTIHRIAALPEVREEVRRLRQELWALIQGRMLDACHRAIETLDNLMREGNDPNVRLRAATVLLDRLAPPSDASAVAREASDGGAIDLAEVTRIIATLQQSLEPPTGAPPTAPNPAQPQPQPQPDAPVADPPTDPEPPDDADQPADTDAP